MDLGGASDVRGVLQRVGELLAAEGDGYAVVVVGGAALNLLGVVERATTDVDILAFADSRADGPPDLATLSEPPEPIPEPLRRAAAIVARDVGLAPDWLNTGPSLQWRAGLPRGLARRVQWQPYAALWIGIVSRYDLIFLKLFAAADSTGTGSVHYQDLLALNPTPEELAEASAWVRTQDAAPAFGKILELVVSHVRQDLGHR